MISAFTIPGLTPHQRLIADMLLSCGDMEDVSFVLNVALTDEDRAAALTLIEIIHHENAEKDIHKMKNTVDKLFFRLMRK